MRDGDDALRVYLDTEVGQDPEGLRRVDDTPFCLGILGDFSGSAGRRPRGKVLDLASRLPVRVTPDNVLELAGFSPEMKVELPGDGLRVVRIAFSSMEDFHPDRLLERLDVFEAHRAARRRILEEPTEVGGPDSAGPTPPAPGSIEAPESPGDDSGAGLLDAVLDETDAETPEGEDPLQEDLDAFIRRVVRPHRMVPAENLEAELEALDEDIGVLMGMILRDPGFQALETLWRSVVFLLSRIQVGTKLRVYLIDVSKAELESDLLRADEPENWSLTRPILAPLSEHGEAIQWAALVGAYDFGGHLDDTLVLQRVGLLAEAAGVPWFSAGHSALLGCGSLVDTPDPGSWSDPVDPLWTELRGNPEAAWIGLAMPGFFLRDAYGSEVEDTRAFRFKDSGREPGDRLWGNPAFLCGVALGRAFNESGWSLRLGGRQRIEGIPLPAPAEEEMVPVVHGLSHSAAERVMAEGMIPVVAARGEAGVFLPRIGSIASGGGPLKAWWNRNV